MANLNHIVPQPASCEYAQYPAGKHGIGVSGACSNRGPMLEVLGDSGVYFDPEQPRDIARALRELIDSPQLRAQASHQRAQQFPWQRCADETFGFLVEVAW